MLGFFEEFLDFFGLNVTQNDLIAPKMAPYTPLWAPKNVLKTSLGAKITAKNAFSDLGGML